MTCSQILQHLTRRLTEYNVASPRVEAELMLAEVLHCSRTAIFLEQRPIPESAIETLKTFLERRKTGEPWQYIAGHAPFMDLELTVTPAVLIPRPETEILVETILNNLPPNAKVIDVGCGSGAIALSLAYARKDIHVLALEYSHEAMRVAQANAQNYQLDNVEFRSSNLLSSLSPAEYAQFDWIAANLPYIAEDEFKLLPREVRNFEPVLALTADEDGCALIRRLIPQAVKYLRPGGKLILEIGETQREKLWGDLDIFAEKFCIQDYCQRDRFLLAVKSSCQTGAPAPLP